MSGMHQSFLSTMHSRPKRPSRRTPHASVGDLLGGVHGSVASQTRSTLCDICSSQAWHNQGWASYSVHLRGTIPRWSLWTPPWVTSGCHPVLSNGRCLVDPRIVANAFGPYLLLATPPINHPVQWYRYTYRWPFASRPPPRTNLSNHAREVCSYL